MGNIEAVLYSAFDRDNTKPIIDFIRWLASSCQVITKKSHPKDAGAKPRKVHVSDEKLRKNANPMASTPRDQVEEVPLSPPPQPVAIRQMKESD